MKFATGFVRVAAIVISFTAACGGGTTSSSGSSSGDAGPDAAGDGAVGPTDSGPSDSLTSPDGASAVCGQLDAKYRALRTTDAYLTCTTSADCTIVSSDVCYDTPSLSLNAAGVAASKDLRSQWHQLGDCGVNDCGSGGGVLLTAGCPAGKCVALYSDGGIAP